MENILFSIISWACALLFGIIAVVALKKKTPIHFWAGMKVDSDEITDIPAYNRANAVMWAIYALCFVASAVAALFHIGMGAALLVAASTVGIVWLIATYRKIYKKYSAKKGANQSNV